jgi:Terminase RNaseH-like domain
MFKDLQKLVQQSQQERNSNYKEFERLRDKPFWIWDTEAHKEEAVNTKGDCCFNHICGLPMKGKLEKPLFDYEKLLYDSLFNTEYHNTLKHAFKHKHLWVKKSTGLGVTEFFLRLMAWLCLRNDDYRNSQMCIVTGPNIDIAIKLIKRMKALFEPKLHVTFDSKETVLELNGCTIEAYPSNHIDAYRALENPKFILIDEGDFFRKGEQEDVRHVSERYIAKSDPYIVMVSTPNGPGGLFERIEKEPEETCIYKRLLLDYTYGLDKIYTGQEIEKAKASPSFEREYNLKYLGGIGNVFNPADIDAATSTQYDIVEYPTLIQGIMGIDPGWGTSNFGIVITHLVDGLIRVAYADQYSRSDHSEMVSTVWDLIQHYNVTKVLVDASAPSFIRALKLQWDERPDYENVDKHMREYMRIEPVAFGVEHKALLYHAKFLLENKYVQIHPTMDKLITALRSSWAKDGVLDKEVTAFDDLVDSFRLSLRPYKEQSTMQ